VSSVTLPRSLLYTDSNITNKRLSCCKHNTFQNVGSRQKALSPLLWWNDISTWYYHSRWSFRSFRWL